MIETQTEFMLTLMRRSPGGGDDDWTSAGLPSHTLPIGAPIPAVGDQVGDFAATPYRVVWRAFMYDDDGGFEVHLGVEPNVSRERGGSEAA